MSKTTARILGIKINGGGEILVSAEGSHVRLSIGAPRLEGVVVIMSSSTALELAALLTKQADVLIDVDN